MAITVDNTGVGTADAGSVTLTVAHNAVIYVHVGISNASSSVTGASVTDNGNGLTYTQRASVQSGNTLFGGCSFYAVNTGGAMSGKTLSATGNTGGTCTVSYISFLGVNLVTPIDPNSGLPVTGRFAGGADPLSISTNATSNAILGCFTNGNTSVGAGSGFTLIGNPNSTVFEYAILTNGPQSGLSVSVAAGGAGTFQTGIADALQAGVVVSQFPPTLGRVGV